MGPRSIFYLLFLCILFFLVVSSYLFLFWVLLLPLRFFCINFYMKIEHACYYCLLGFLVGTEWFSGTEVHEMGAELTLHARNPNEGYKLLMMANHQSFSDVLVTLHSFMSHSGYSILWIVYAGLKYTNFGLISITHGDFFVAPKQFKEGDLTKHVQKSYNRDKNLFFIFPEGGIKDNVQDVNDRYVSKMGLEPLANVVYPRWRAIADLLAPEIGLTHLVDLTILYPGHPIGIFELLIDVPKEPIILLYKIFEITDEGDSVMSHEYHPYIKQIPRSRITNDWLVSLWKEKDQLIDLYNTNKVEFMRIHGASERHIEVSFFMLFCTHIVYFWLVGIMIILMVKLYIIL